jgi:hypothetical protein
MSLSVFTSNTNKSRVGYAGVLHDIGHVAQGQNVVVGNGVLMGIEGHEFAIDLVSARQLGLVIGLERKDIQFAVTHDDGPRILSPDRQALDNFSGNDVHHRDLVLR